MDVRRYLSTIRREITLTLAYMRAKSAAVEATQGAACRSCHRLSQSMTVRLQSKGFEPDAGCIGNLSRGESPGPGMNVRGCVVRSFASSEQRGGDKKATAERLRESGSIRAGMADVLCFSTARSITIARTKDLKAGIDHHCQEQINGLRSIPAVRNLADYTVLRIATRDPCRVIEAGGSSASDNNRTGL